MMKAEKIEENDFCMTLGEAKQKPKSYEEFIERKKSKDQMMKEAQDKIAALSPAAIEQTMKLELERLKAERLKGSFSYAQVAEEFNIYLRTFKEYVSGRRKPGKGEAATRYEFALEKYYLNPDINRWFIRDDYQAEQDAKQQQEVEVEVDSFSFKR